MENPIHGMRPLGWQKMAWLRHFRASFRQKSARQLLLKYQDKESPPLAWWGGWGPTAPRIAIG